MFPILDGVKQLTLQAETFKNFNIFTSQRL